VLQEQQTQLQGITFLDGYLMKFLWVGWGREKTMQSGVMSQKNVERIAARITANELEFS
jgi:hypothetical protein